MIGQVVIQWLERKFDCRVRRLIFQKSDLRKIVNDSMEYLYGPDQDEFRGKNLFNGKRLEAHLEALDGTKFVSHYNHTHVGDKANRPIELTYGLPAELIGLKTISVTIPADEARQLLARLDPQIC